ncbi:MAG: cadherin-like domain-containing protein, partial [Paludibacteraceae bacterium]|nr:cadherin-like domain-containing protein [Paludibacteraceae bacterium]
FFEVDAKNLAADGMPLNPLNEYEGIENDNVMMVDEPIFLLNSAPESMANDTVVPAGRSVTGNVLNNDADVDGDALVVLGYMVNGDYGSLGDPLTIAKEGLECGVFTLNADGSYTFAANASYDGMVPDIYYSISDGFTGNSTYTGEDLIPGMDTSRMNIQVMPNHFPTVTPTEVSINRSGDRTWLPIVISDEDGDPLTVSVSGADAALYEVGGDSVYYVGPAVSAETVSHFDLTVDDGVRTPVVTPITVTIKVNQAPTLSPDSVSIYVKVRTERDTCLVPVVFSDPDGDGLVDVRVERGSSYFQTLDGKLYFMATRNNTRSVSSTTYPLTMFLQDDKGVSASLPLAVTLNVISDDINESIVYAEAVDIYYGDPLSASIDYGANTTGTWRIVDSIAGEVGLDQVLSAGRHSLDFIFTPSTEGYSAAMVEHVRFNVLPRAIVLASGTAEKTYDGEAFSVPSVSVVSGSWFGTDSFTYSNFATLTSADTVENTFSYAAVAGTSLSNYDVTIQYGSLIVTPRPITLSSASATKTFDGSPLTEPTVTVTSGSLVGADAFVYSDFASITGAGSVDNTFIATPAPGVTLSNYDITVEYGKLTVEPFEWTGDYEIILSENTYLYDGTAHQPSVTIVAQGYTLDQMFYNVRYENDVNVGDSAMAIISPKENSGIIFRTDTASYSITKRSIVIKSASCEQVYDGNTLTCHDIESVTGDSLAEGDSFTPTYTASLQDVGEVENSFQVAIDERNYNVTLVPGSLKVTPRAATLSETTVEWSDTSFVYDGEAHCPSATITVDGLVLDPARDYTVTCSDNVQVGKKTAVARVSKKENGNFIFDDYDAQFSITPAIVTITDKSVATKTYDGSTSATVTLNTVT